MCVGVGVGCRREVGGRGGETGGVHANSQHV